jgi:8-oxo-dGTP pyrophosphatase MutT (NUDIX family)
MTEYVLGFAFTYDFNNVVLIKKSKPEWQAGLLNGIGGKVEPSDGFHNRAMAREYREETGVITLHDQWKWFAQMSGKDFAVYCYYIVNDSAVRLVRSAESEVVGVYSTDIVPNLSWLIPMAIDFASNGQDAFTETNY